MCVIFSHYADLFRSSVCVAAAFVVVVFVVVVDDVVVVVVVVDAVEIKD